jgi:hypothetical protein
MTIDGEDAGAISLFVWLVALLSASRERRVCMGGRVCCGPPNATKPLRALHATRVKKKITHTRARAHTHTHTHLNAPATPHAGRIEMELYAHCVPKTAENFRALVRRRCACVAVSASVLCSAQPTPRRVGAAVRG